jgi:cytochrome c biogenesis protein
MKTALFLMTIIILISIWATFQPNTLIYNSYFFKGLLFLLIINVTLCTMKRLPGLWLKLWRRHLSFGKVRQAFSPDLEFGVSDPVSAKERLTTGLRKKGYRIEHLKEDQDEIVFAVQGKLSLVASQIIHISLIVLFIGVLISTFGYSGELTGPVKGIVKLPENITGNDWSVRIDAFNTIYNPDRSIENWETELTIIRGHTDSAAKEIIRGKTRVNHPFTYQGVTFYQSGYGSQCVIELGYNDMKKQSTVPLNQVITSNGMSLIIEKQDFQTYVMKFYDRHQNCRRYELKKGTVIYLTRKLSLQLIAEKTFTILKFKSDPGIPVIMAGLVLLAFGFVLLYTRIYREIKILFQPANQTAQIQVHCKSKICHEQLVKEILSYLSEGLDDEFVYI